ncbi:MAG: YfhO family protein, partial [Candidatus Woesebacteria bacterium]
TVETLGSGSPFIHPQNLVTLIAPDFFGNDATYNFWGKGDHMDSTLYVGIATVVLAVYALIKTYKNKYVRFSIILTVTAALLAFRNPVSSLVYQTGLWGGSSITMNRINFIFNFCLAVLASFGVSLIEKKTAKSVLKYALSLLTLLLFLIAGLFVYKLTLGVPLDPVALLKFADTGSNSLIHTNIALRNLAWPTLLSAGVVFTVWFFKKLPRFKHFFIPALMVVLIVDLFRFGWKFNTFSSKKYIYPDTPISEFLKQYPNDRFAAENDIFPANMWVPFGLSTISGYDSIYPYRSAKLLAVANSGNVDATPQPRWGILSNFSSELIDISNVRFLVTLKRDKQGKIDENGNVANNNLPDKFIPVYEDRGIVVMENKNSLPRAYMTNKVIKTPDAETISLLINEGVESGKIAYSNDFGLSTNNDLPLEYSAEYRQVTNSHVVVTTSANQDAFLVVSDSYYPGWQVFVDGNRSSIHRANYNYRGVFLKEGEHFVEFIFFPDSLKYGIVISAISLVTTLFITFKKGKKITPGP